MILACQNISKSFGVEPVIRNVSFHVEDQEKVAIVGINGAGKSTLLKIVVGELPADEGTVTLAKGKTLGYLAQHQDIADERTIYEAVLEGKRQLIDMEQKIRELEEGMQSVSKEEMESYMESYHKLLHEFEARDGYSYRSEVSGVLKGLGFSENDFEKHCNELSGGQKTRVSLARLLVTHPDIILLDEPTNHLDIESIQWLETFLMNYKGAVVIVAHDRYFLDRIVTKVVEIENHKARMYSGNYSAFAEKKAQIRDAELKAWMNQQQEIKHQEEVIAKLKSFNREKSIKRAESREKMLEKTERLEKPQEVNAYMHLSLIPDVQSGNDVLHIEGLSKAFGEQRLFSNIDIDIKRSEKVALIGDNGTGKTTILKIINQVIPADKGLVHLGSNVHIGYYDQEHQVLDMNKTIFDEISDTWPSMTHTRIRNVLAAFLFTGDDVFKYIRDLSGGERGRVSLAKLMLSDANLLILDEPTNHLDIMSREILENALRSYSGTVLFVSHDRYFINQVATRILELSENGLANYNGNYDYYVEKQLNPSATESSGESVASETVTTETVSAAKMDYKQQKELQAKERKRKNQLKKTMERIDAIDARLKELDELLVQEDVYTNVSRLMEINKEKEALDEEQLTLMELWEELEGGDDSLD